MLGRFSSPVGELIQDRRIGGCCRGEVPAGVRLHCEYWECFEGATDDCVGRPTNICGGVWKV